MQLELNTVKILDSLNYLPFPLSALPKAFGLPETKGHFPYLFNTAANLNYIGPMPAAKSVYIGDVAVNRSIIVQLQVLRPRDDEAQTPCRV